MKVIISPSKTQDFNRKIDINHTTPVFYNKTTNLVEIISKMSKDELKDIMKIKDKLLDNTYESYKKFNINNINHAISTYNGGVFKEIDISSYDIYDFEFLNDHLYILSALYGLLKPLDGIKPYRLDMNMKIIDGSLYSYWSRDINEVIKNEDTIINLASKEFSKLIKLPMINIEFKEIRNNKLKTIGTYAKKARGMMVNYIVKNKIENINDILKFNLDGYSYNDDISHDKNIIFTR